MKERTLFYIMICFVVFMTVIETGHDYNVILAGAKDGTWKLWGNAYDFIWIAAITLALVGYEMIEFRAWRILLWIPILWLIWWIVHDVGMGLWLTGNPLYIGIGKADSWIGAIFQQSGLLLLIFKAVNLTIGIGWYLRLSRV